MKRIIVCLLLIFVAGCNTEINKSSAVVNNLQEINLKTADLPEGYQITSQKELDYNTTDWSIYGLWNNTKPGEIHVTEINGGGLVEIGKYVGIMIYRFDSKEDSQAAFEIMNKFFVGYEGFGHIDLGEYGDKTYGYEFKPYNYTGIAFTDKNIIASISAYDKDDAIKVAKILEKKI